MSSICNSTPARPNTVVRSSSVPGFNSRGAPLTIDFGGGTVEAMSVNGGSFKAADYNGFFITVPAAALRAGSNDVRIRYRHPWSTESSGLFRFTDPEDGRSYVYTDFEAYAANRAFPCFDQPDIKASYALGVEVPASWQVISATRETRVSDSGDTRRWTFARSARFSTYLFSLHTGEYQVWEDREARIPSRLFARHSIAAHVPVDDWFRWTRAGFGFFEDYFGIAYPFLKYDQVLVPEYASGAMENVAAVVFDENLVGRGQLTATARETIANTILHEMAHMWFGNLVTMQWWNGLWLNERVLPISWHSSPLPKPPSSGRLAQLLRLRENLGLSRRCARDHAPDRGGGGGRAQFLRQLRWYLLRQGCRDSQAAVLPARAEAFRSGVARICGNVPGATPGSRISWPRWRRQADATSMPGPREWLLAAGTNTVRATVQCTAGQLQSLTLLQALPRPVRSCASQRLKVALYREGDGSPYQVIDTVASGRQQRGFHTGQIACPDFVWPNHQDWAFARPRPQPRPISTSCNAISCSSTIR
ncbi:MAG: hypothetical protein IPO61_07290 [Gammaproteobacteria bacterium]|nr:hypothetical protein [Gammaproteobacteria bacterium]